MADLIPRTRFNAPQRADADPFFSLHHEMNRLFDDTFRDFGIAPFGREARSFPWPSVEVAETERDVRVTAELAGLEEKDIELRVENNVLTLRGEKRTESEDKDRQYSERYYGRFERRLPIQAEVDEDAAQATFKNGVLTVILPKTARAKDAVRRIPIKQS